VRWFRSEPGQQLEVLEKKRLSKIPLCQGSSGDDFPTLKWAVCPFRYQFGFDTAPTSENIDCFAGIHEHLNGSLTLHMIRQKDYDLKRWVYRSMGRGNHARASRTNCN